MIDFSALSEIVTSTPSKIVMLVVDGLGGAPHPDTGRSELETANLPNLDRLAREGEGRAHNFPRPMMRDESHDFSFSGLKTSVRYFIRDNPGVLEDGQRLRDLCAGVQAAIVEVLVAKTIRAAKKLSAKYVTASGGVTCNSGLRAALGAAGEREGFVLRLANPTLCTDNAAMVGMIAHMHLAKGTAATSLDAEIAPGWKLAESAVC